MFFQFVQFISQTWHSFAAESKSRHYNDLSFPSLFSTNEIIVFTPADALIDAAFQVSFVVIMSFIYHWDWHKLFKKIERAQVASLSRVDYPILYE